MLGYVLYPSARAVITYVNLRVAYLAADVQRTRWLSSVAYKIPINMNISSAELFSDIGLHNT